MSIYNRNMPQNAIYWPPGSNDGAGSKDFSAIVPVVVVCRWQDDVTVSRDKEGNEFTAEHIVYVGQEVLVEGYLKLGDVAPAAGTDPHADGAKEIRRVYATRSLDGEEILVKALL